MKWNKQFKYPTSKRINQSGSRWYEISGKKLPSVTTVLKGTESEEKRKSLEEWRNKVGEVEAERIISTSSRRGTQMHQHLEEFLIGQVKINFEGFDNEPYQMSKKIIENSLSTKLNELWGAEVNLHFPNLYAGTADACGVYNGVESILDFKQSNKLKQRNWLDDYFLQVAAYSLAHNEVYKTKITQGVILVCTPALQFQEFIIKDNELKKFQMVFLKKVEEYKGMLN
tara:strand:- start:385 stop:1065 length:681 start_codon:yes stop_codon:yes gene_type:complete